MRNAMLGFAVALVIMTVITIAQAQTTGFSIQKASPTLAHTTTNQAPPNAKRDSTTVEKKISTSPRDELKEHFRKARESFLTKDARAAAAEIRKGAMLLKLEAGHAKEKAKEALTASSRELEKLAQELEKGTVTSSQDLRRAFARADRALAAVAKEARATATKPMKETGGRSDQVNQELDEG